MNGSGETAKWIRKHEWQAHWLTAVLHKLLELHAYSEPLNRKWKAILSVCRICISRHPGAAALYTEQARYRYFTTNVPPFVRLSQIREISFPSISPSLLGIGVLTVYVKPHWYTYNFRRESHRFGTILLSDWCRLVRSPSRSSVTPSIIQATDIWEKKPGKMTEGERDRGLHRVIWEGGASPNEFSGCGTVSAPLFLVFGYLSPALIWA